MKPTQGYTYILESADEWGGVDDPALAPTHIQPTLYRPYMGATNSNGIFESADVHGSATHQNEGMLAALRLSSRTLKGEPPMSTHVRPIVSPPHMGAANSSSFLSTSCKEVNIGWLLDL